MDHGVSKGYGAELRETERERFFRGLGRTVVGPFLADLVRWLLARSQEDGVERLYFLSRDAYLFYYAYRRAAVEEVPGSFPEARYLCVSRESLGLCGASRRRAEEYRNCRSYLLQEGVSERCGIVDIGWHGSCAARISQLCGLQGGLYGYYFGYLGDAPQARAYLGRGGSFLCESCVGLLEMLFREETGEEIRYERDGGRWVPRRTAAGHSGSDALLHRMQEEALETAGECLRRNRSRRAAAAASTARLLRIGLLPTARERRILGALQMEEEGRCRPLAGPRAPGVYLLHPRLWMRDYHRSLWKCGFLADMGAGPAACLLWLVLRTSKRVLLYAAQTCYNIQDRKSCIGSLPLPGKHK